MEPRSSQTISAPPQTGGAADPDIIVEAPLWRRLIPNVERLAKRAATIGGGAGTIVLTTDHAVRLLNARHRGRNRPTNVLTFDPPMPGMGGDIILALGTLRREAAAADRRLSHHLAHLIIHGALHLQGHDHALAGEARQMEREETRLLQRMRVPNPWRRT